MIFLPWRYGLSLSTTHSPCFPSSNITKNAETHPPPLRDVIIENPIEAFENHFLQISEPFLKKISCRLFWQAIDSPI